MFAHSLRVYNWVILLRVHLAQGSLISIFILNRKKVAKDLTLVSSLYRNTTETECCKLIRIEM